jgi:beta-lactamase class A/beta-lactamase class A VEB
MTKIIYLTAFIFLLSCHHVYARTSDDLKQKIERIVSAKNAVAGVAITGNDGGGTVSVSINGEKRFPMQSVFKFHIGLAVLSAIDKGSFTLDQKITIPKNAMLETLFSPIRDEYPEGAELTIAKILEYTVSQSDNVGCDALLRLLDGPDAVERYFAENNFTDISIKINENVMQKYRDLQFQNWTTPNSANRVLESFYYNEKKLLSQKKSRLHLENNARNFDWKEQIEGIAARSGRRRSQNRLVGDR